MTKKEIIEDFEKHYGKNPERRSLKDGVCCYKSGQKRCAVGRWIEDIDDIINRNYNRESVRNLVNYYKGDSFLKPEVQGHNLCFWEELQDIHDNPYNWGDEGLNSEGIKELNKLKHKYYE